MATTITREVALKLSFADTSTRTLTFDKLAPFDGTGDWTLSGLRGRIKNISAGNDGSKTFNYKSQLISKTGQSCTGITEATYTQTETERLYNRNTYSA